VAPPVHAGPLRQLGQRLNSDWLVSRQRFFACPSGLVFVGADGEPDTARPIIPDEAALPSTHHRRPPGFEAASAISRAVSPATLMSWTPGPRPLSPADRLRVEDDPALFAATFPWTCAPGPRDHPHLALLHVVRSHFEHGILPWRATTINGWILDPDRKKMSKSKGNVITPMPLIEEFGSDAVRYWACNGRRARHRPRHRHYEDRPPPGHQDPQRLQVHPGRLGDSAARAWPR